MTAVAELQQSPAARFAIPPDGEATTPPEQRGLRRDGVRLLVARPGHIEHRRFHELAALLDPGDVLVINTSATVPAALDGRLADGSAAPVHLSTVLDDGSWVVEIRRPGSEGPNLAMEAGATVLLPDRLALRLGAAYPDESVRRSRLWRASPSQPVDVLPYLSIHGRPIEYSYLSARHPLADHQTVYATEPGSAEMASAGRPFTAPLLVRLMAAGVTVAPIVLHAGVSSPEAGEAPLPERYRVPEATATLVAGARRGGRRVIAVGTTTVRALESATSSDGEVHGSGGWTDLVLSPKRPARLVNGLVTGLHAPEASHLLLLEAVAGPALVAAAYDSAVARRYLWHEFGDTMLFLPG